MKRETIEYRIRQLEHEYMALVRSGHYAQAQAMKPKMEREQRKLRITLAEEQVMRLKQNGTLERIGQKLSAVQLLTYVANNLVEEVAEEFEHAGLRQDALLGLHRSFVKAADGYFSEFARLVKDNGSKMDMFADFDDFDRLFRRWAKLDEGPLKPHGTWEN